MLHICQKFKQMINAIIYLDQNNEAEYLVKEILSSGLAASASIDVDNSYYIHQGDKVFKTSHTVITLQTKSLLFKQLTDLVYSKMGYNVPVFSVPILHANDFFDRFIRESTNKI